VEKQDMIAELDAVVTLLYGLSRDAAARSCFETPWNYETMPVLARSGEAVKKCHHGV